MKATLRLACIVLLIATTIAAYAVAVIGTGEKLSAPALDEAQGFYLTPAAAETLAMYASPPGPPLTADQRANRAAFARQESHIPVPLRPGYTDVFREDAQER